MAKKKTAPDNSTSSVEGNNFYKGLVKDYDELYFPDGSWSHARNAENNSFSGELGVLGNESSTLRCASAPYTIIGAVHIFSSYWAIFSTDETNSEIGLFDEDRCSYRTIVNDPCLSLSKFSKLVTGQSKEMFDCSWQIYFADGLNPDRVLNIGIPETWPSSTYLSNNYYENNVLWPGVAWNQSCTEPTDKDPCIICTDLNTLNCERIRLASLVKVPCITTTLGNSGGNLYDGSYFAAIAYTINEQRVTDYLSLSNVQPIFDHGLANGSLEINITNLETEYFDQFELVVVSTVAQQVVAKRIGIYSTETTNIYLDTISPELVTIPIEWLPLRTPAYEKSDSIYLNGEYLIRVAPTSKYDFNYQPLANQITTKWVVGRYPADYYRKGGYVSGYMRDEIYSFWIRWIYNTGEKSSSYHIPGRAPSQIETSFLPGPGSIYPGGEFYFEVNNTASLALPVSYAIEDGGIAIAEGYMGYFQSTETYPDDQPEIWNPSHDPEISGIPNGDDTYDLCGKNIRHHRMPEDFLLGSDNPWLSRNITDDCCTTDIQPLGVKFENIKPPVYRDRDGLIKVVPGIVGYEILRGSRAGNKTIIAKGMINNMVEYTRDDGTGVNIRGLYQNYPYNPENPDLTLVSQGPLRRDHFTFHSPETSFARPFLNVDELRLYSVIGGDGCVRGNFQEVPGHPKHKLLTDLALLTAAAIGLANAIFAVSGKKTKTIDSPKVLNIGLYQAPGTPVTWTSGSALVPASPAINAPDPLAPNSNAEGNILESAADTSNTIWETLNSIRLGQIFVGNTLGAGNDAQNALSNSINNLTGVLGLGVNYTQEFGLQNYQPGNFNLMGFTVFGNYWSSTTDAALDLIRASVPYRQYAYMSLLHACQHTNRIADTPITNTINGVHKRRLIDDAGYLSDQYQQFQGFEINNLWRPKTVALKTVFPLNQIFTGGGDNSHVIISQIDPSWQNPTQTFFRNAYSYYTAIKLRNRNIYGQLDNIKQVPIKCPQIVNNNEPIGNDAITVSPGLTTIFNVTYNSQALFGGDTYVCRYTEKNTFYYFYDWLYNLPDGTEYNYRLSYLAWRPVFWADTSKYDVAGIVGRLATQILAPNNFGQNENALPQDLRNLDGPAEINQNLFAALYSQLAWGKRDGAFYLFQSAVRDFYVESEINTEFRDWGDAPNDSERHYDPYRFTNLRALFDTDIMRLSEYFKYDNGLSIAKLFSNYVNWGSIQPRDYDPTSTLLCYDYRPNRLIYSLPNFLEQRKDGWRVYLVNNYKDFKSKITAVKPIARSGAMVLFDNDAPLQYQGLDQLETELGTKLTIGDGGLFSQPYQNLSNTEISVEYGSCQDKWSVINTPAGLYYMNQNQGKIMGVAKGLEEISSKNMKWWFSRFLPSQLLMDFPEFELTQNPVAGIGCQAVYDNDNTKVYFSKRDYRLRDEFEGQLTYLEKDRFQYNNAIVTLGDPTFFEDVSWTVSFDPKFDAFVSFHDWHQDLSLMTKKYFITTKGDTLWRHNYRLDSYCNFYGVDYPFEVEFPVQTGQNVNTIRSIEYFLESYIYKNGLDRFQILDFNFDDLIISNSEQVSGLLKLNPADKNNPFQNLTFPQITPNWIDVLYDKVEQKFRVNQFWDITNDRGEFNPNSNQAIWNLQYNGYIKTLNNNNLNYLKPDFERKKFRHYLNKIFLRKNISADKKMFLKIFNTKLLYSPR